VLTHGADVNAQAADGSPPLMYATSARNVEMTHLLLTHGAKPNVQDSDGWTPLARAVLSDSDVNLVRDLMAHGADPNVRNKVGVTPLQEAQRLGRPDLVRLLKRGARSE
jgi:ankyrin repeat protein